MTVHLLDEHSVHFQFHAHCVSAHYRARCLSAVEHEVGKKNIQISLKVLSEICTTEAFPVFLPKNIFFLRNIMHIVKSKQIYQLSDTM